MKNLSRWVTVVLVFGACRPGADADPIKGGSETSADAKQKPNPPTTHCTIESSWLALQGEPPIAAAIGTLTYAMQDPVNAKERKDIEIRWMNGQRSTYVRDELLWSPQGETVPVLGDMHPPAVFAMNGTNALVWSKARGWGCAPTRATGQDEFQSFDESLASAVKVMEQPPNADGYALLRNMVLTVAPQKLRTAPHDDAALSDAEVTATIPCDRSVDRFGWGNQNAPSSATMRTLKWFPHGCLHAVRVVERSGHWAKLVLPKAMYDLDPGLLIAWNDAPSGWAKIEDDGPVPGSRLIKWSVKHWWTP